MLHLKFSRLLFLAPLLLASCSYSSGPEGPPPLPTGKLSGTVKINGEPAPLGQVVMSLYPKGSTPTPGEPVPFCVVGKEGKYEFSSFRDGDGVEPGDYILTMEWLTFTLISGRSGPDRFGNNFNNPTVNATDPKFQVTVAEGEETVVPTIEVETASLKRKPAHPFATRKGKTGK